MKLQINGQVQEFAITVLEELITALDKPEQGIAIAVNEQIIPRQQWASFTLSENDNISLFQAIAGG